jgi:hypothetical protein
VRGDCNDASLQRAVTAYLMAIEQDCNTVQKMLDETKKKMTAAVREGGAMLDLARVKERQERNSSDATACLRNVESAVQSDEVCGAGYRKCLDNGKYIDVTTGKPLIGVVEFYKLQEMLAFAKDTSLSDQRLAKNSSNRIFVGEFEKKVKQFAQPALNKCTDIADGVWADYLDKAMLEIYYAQRAKVDEIKTGCLDFVRSCYVSGQQAVTNAMSGIINESELMIPGGIKLIDETCKKYVDACDNMFEADGQGIIAQYIETKKDQDLTDSCRAIIKQCFDNFGGIQYSNFYMPGRGLFSRGRALDWFSFNGYTASGSIEPGKVSPCAQKLLEINACNPSDNPEFAANLFGGFDRVIDSSTNTIDSISNYHYGLYNTNYTYSTNQKQMHKSGVATEIYNQIVNTLEYDCLNKGGRFMNMRFMDTTLYPASNAEAIPYCKSNLGNEDSNSTVYSPLVTLYKIGVALNPIRYDGIENMCPKDYWNNVDTASWGACNCWENGGRRSENGTSLSCVPGTFLSSSIPIGVDANSCDGTKCSRAVISMPDTSFTIAAEQSQHLNKVCPFGVNTTIPESSYPAHPIGSVCISIDSNTPLSIELMDIIPTAN